MPGSLGESVSSPFHAPTMYYVLCSACRSHILKRGYSFMAADTGAGADTGAQYQQLGDKERA